MNQSLLFGGIAGFGTAIFLFICYRIEPSLYIEPGIIYSTWLIYILCMLMPLLLLRSNQNMTFKEGLRASFVVFIIANAIYYTFDYLMVSYVDPAIIEMQYERIKAASDNEFLAPMQEELKNSDPKPSISNYIFIFAQSLIVGFVVSAIMAYSLKQES